MTKGRKPLPPAEQAGPQFVHQTPPAMAEQERRMMTAIEQQESNAQALAVALGYEGSMTVGSLEDEIRFYQRRTAEACLEMGKRLMILKELTPHGEFKQRVELLGIEYTLASRFMGAATKFGKVATPQLLKAANSQSKMLELLILDDEEVAELEAGGSARGITRDKMETMSHRELRVALREATAKQQATERLLSAKNEKIDELSTKLSLLPLQPADERLEALRQKAGALQMAAESAVGEPGLHAGLRALFEHHREHGGNADEVINGYIGQVERICREMREEFGLIEGLVKQWAAG